MNGMALLDTAEGLAKYVRTFAYLNGNVSLESNLWQELEAHGQNRSGV